MDNNIKKLAESILNDITSDQSIANILLKTKVFASKCNDMDLLNWVSNELSGYKQNIPEYRIIGSSVKVDVHRGFQVVLGYQYPIDMIEDKKIRDRVSHIPINNPIYEIEEMGNKDDSNMVHMEIPTPIWYYHMGHCINGEIQRAYQVGTISSIKNIIVSVKSVLIDYFLKLSNDENIQFSSLIKKDSSLTVNNITASIVNTSDGYVVAGDINTVVGDSNTIDPKCSEDLIALISKLDEIMIPKDEGDYQDLSEDVKRELKKEKPSKKILKRCFQAIGGLANGVASGVLANQVTPYVQKALSML